MLLHKQQHHAGLSTYYLMVTNLPAPCVTVNQRGHWLRTGTCFTRVFAACIILTKVGGGSRASQDPPSYVPVNYIVDEISAIKFKAARIHFLSDVFVAVVVVVTSLKPPSIYTPGTPTETCGVGNGIACEQQTYFRSLSDDRKYVCCSYVRNGMAEILIYVPPMPGGNLFLSALYGGIACESHIKKDTRKNITKNIARKDHQ